MLKAILRRTIARFERTWSYDASYMRDLLDLSSTAFIQFGMVTALGRRREAPAVALAAAGIVGTLAEDCGPCTQIGVDIATKAGVDPAILRAILAGDEAGMGPDAALAYRFAHASLAREVERADPLRDEIVRRWGQEARRWPAWPETTAPDCPRRRRPPRPWPGLFEGSGGRRAGAVPARGIAGGMTEAPDLEAFEAQRPRLTRLAYRMLGSLAEAVAPGPPAALARPWPTIARRSRRRSIPGVTTRLCIDRLRAAAAARKAYRGPWLPEPLIEDIATDPLERAEDVSVAFLLALERLSPLERAVFLLHEAFDADYAQIAQTLGRSQAACRQLAARARSHVQDARPRFQVSDADAAKLAGAFMEAASGGDWSRL